MKCAVHPGREATARCAKCKEPLCDECRILLNDGKISVCYRCYEEIKRQPINAITVRKLEQRNDHTLKKCKYCGNAIPRDAVICTSCGRQLEKLKQASGSKRIPLWVIVIAILAVLYLIGTFSSNDNPGNISSVRGNNQITHVETVSVAPNATTEVETTQRKEYDYEITDIEAIFKEYEDNAVAADKKYNGKTVKVSGIFMDSGKNMFDEYYINVGTGKTFSWDYFQCYFSNSAELDKVLNYKTGDEITIVGKVGDNFLSIELVNCKIQ